jgi:hypothetical protein
VLSGLYLPRRGLTQPAQQVHREPAQQPQAQSRRFDHPLLPEGFTGQGQGSQLAPRPGLRLHPDAAHVLAEGHGALDPQRQLDAADGEAGSVGPCAAGSGVATM